MAAADDGVWLYYEETGSGHAVDEMKELTVPTLIITGDGPVSIVGDFLASVESGRWPMRDPRAMSASITGMKS